MICFVAALRMPACPFALALPLALSSPPPTEFVGVRVLAVKLTGPMSKKHVIVQPCPFGDSTVIRGEVITSPDMIYAAPNMVQ